MRVRTHPHMITWQLTQFLTHFVVWCQWLLRVNFRSFALEMWIEEARGTLLVSLEMEATWETFASLKRLAVSKPPKVSLNNNNNLIWKWGGKGGDCNGSALAGPRYNHSVNSIEISAIVAIFWGIFADSSIPAIASRNRKIESNCLNERKGVERLSWNSRRGLN